MSTTTIEIETPSGVARAHLSQAEQPRAALILGHGAGGGVGAKDLQAAGHAARSAGLSVALIEQPYRVLGRRSPAPARQLDAAWIAVAAYLREHELRGLAPISGGRSSGARVACRTAEDCGAIAVLCLAFPLQPPARRATGIAAPSRLPELEQVGVPMLVLQGERDPFGMPPARPGRTVVQVPGDHSLRIAGAQVQAAVAAWLSEVVLSLRPA